MPASKSAVTMQRTASSGTFALSTSGENMMRIFMSSVSSHCEMRNTGISSPIACGVWAFPANSVSCFLSPGEMGDSAIPM